MRHQRQTDIFDPARHTDKRVTVVGLGNLGSHTALALARMGVDRLRLVDFDTVAEHNLASQCYGTADVGVRKCDALASQVRAVATPRQLDIYPTAIQRAGLEWDADDILVSAVDTVEARREMRELLPPTVPVFDGRMGGGQIEMHHATAADWTIPERVSDDPCAARYISYTSVVLAGLITSAVRLYLTGAPVPTHLYMHLDTFEIITPGHG